MAPFTDLQLHLCLLRKGDEMTISLLIGVSFLFVLNCIIEKAVMQSNKTFNLN